MPSVEKQYFQYFPRAKTSLFTLQINALFLLTQFICFVNTFSLPSGRFYLPGRKRPLIFAFADEEWRTKNEEFACGRGTIHSQLSILHSQLTKHNLKQQIYVNNQNTTRPTRAASSTASLSTCSPAWKSWCPTASAYALLSNYNYS